MPAKRKLKPRLHSKSGRILEYLLHHKQGKTYSLTLCDRHYQESRDYLYSIVNKSTFPNWTFKPNHWINQASNTKWGYNWHEMFNPSKPYKCDFCNGKKLEDFL